MIYLGVFCFIYYMVIQVYTKRRNSTFLLFWFIAGMACLILEWLRPHYPGWLQSNTWIFLIPWCVFVVIEIFICSAMFQVPAQNLPCIIVLGAQIRGTAITNSLERRLIKAIEYLDENPETRVIVSGGQGNGESISEAEAMAAYLEEHGMLGAQIRGTAITNSLERRLIKALEYLDENPETRVIVSGGQGNGESISEAEAMASYLEEHGIAPERIWQENHSTSTEENLHFSQKLISDITAPVGIVTNNFHMYRALRTARKLGFTQTDGIPATSNPVLFLNYMVREFFACFYHLVLKR